MGEVNYRVRQPGRRKPTQLYHVNLLKQWKAGTTPPVPAPMVLVARQGVPEVPMGEDLSPTQKQDLTDVVLQHQDVFSEVPGRTTVAHHDIRTEAGVTVRVPPYRVPEARRVAIREEVKKMLQLRVIEESHSTWSSPIVLVPKPDGSFRFCNDLAERGLGVRRVPNAPGRRTHRAARARSLPHHPRPYQGILAGPPQQDRPGEKRRSQPPGVYTSTRCSPSGYMELRPRSSA